MRTYFGNHEGLYLARVWDVRADAQVDHGTTTIDSGRGTVRDLALDKMLLVFVVLNHRG